MSNPASTQYMVDFTLPSTVSEDFLNRISDQRHIVNQMLSEGKLVNYALSLENSKLWAIFKAASEVELLQLVSGLPLSRFMQVQVSELTFCSTAQPQNQFFSVN